MEIEYALKRSQQVLHVDRNFTPFSLVFCKTFLNFSKNGSKNTMLLLGELPWVRRHDYHSVTSPISYSLSFSLS